MSNDKDIKKLPPALDSEETLWDIYEAAYEQDCLHVWLEYRGIKESYYYCNICDLKKFKDEK